MVFAKHCLAINIEPKLSILGILMLIFSLFPFGSHTHTHTHIQIYIYIYIYIERERERKRKRERVIKT